MGCRYLLRRFLDWGLLHLLIIGTGVVLVLGLLLISLWLKHGSIVVLLVIVKILRVLVILLRRVLL